MTRKIKPKVCVLDLDDTVSQFLPFLCHLHNKLHGTCLTESDITDWNFDSLDVKDVRGNHVTGTQLRETFEKYEPHGLYACLPPLDVAKRALKVMGMLGYRVILLTARKAEYEAQTRLNLVAHDIHHDELYFNHDKVKEIKKLAKIYNVQLFADDNYQNVLNVSENCNVNNVFLIDKGHNRHYDEPDDIVRINNLFDSVRYLKEVK